MIHVANKFRNSRRSYFISSFFRLKTTSTKGITPPVKLVLPPKPEEPRMEECCGNSCRLCVWTTYWEKLEEWEKEVALIKEKASKQSKSTAQFGTDVGSKNDQKPD